MDDIIICEITHFSYPANDIFLFGFEYRFSDKKEQIDKYIDNPVLWNMAGISYKNGLMGKPYFVLKTFYEKEEDFENDLLVYYRNFEMITKNLWFSKDNSCNIFRLTALWHGDRFFQIGSNTKFSDAQGRFIKSIFSRADFELAGNVIEKYYETIPDTTSDVYHSDYKEDSIKFAYEQVSYKDMTRLNRAMNFLDAARSERFLPSKITYYVFILESLFSANDGAEILHKISERVAIYIGSSLQERQEIYAKIKVYYNIRSKYIHGQAVEGNTNDFNAYSIELDALVRRILTNVILEDSKIFLKSEKELKRWFNEQLFK